MLVEDGRAVGVRVKGGKEIRAKQAVVSNADLYNTFNLVPKVPPSATYQIQSSSTNVGKPMIYLNILSLP